MKNFLILVLTALLCLSFCACSSDDSSDTSDNSENASTVKKDDTQPQASSPSDSVETTKDIETSKATETTVVTEPPIVKTTMGISEFDTLLSTLPVTVESTEYVIQDEEYKALYPDMLQAIIANNTSSDIKNAVLAFVAWDSNSLPVKIKGNHDYSDGAYIKKVNYSDINLIPDATYGHSSGFSIDKGCNISSFETIVVSFETFEGEKWTNPYYDEWCELYEGVKYTDSLTVEVTEADADFTSNTDSKDTVDESALLAEIGKQEVRVVSTKYVIQDERYKALYPDMLQAIIQNDTDLDIKNAVVAFVAWDSNGLPVKIIGNHDYSDGAYIKKVNYNDINLIPGASYGNSSGFSVEESCNIDKFNAIVVRYEAFDGTTWNNPLYQEWCTLYEGVKNK